MISDRMASLSNFKQGTKLVILKVKFILAIVIFFLKILCR